jgi:hypothetical protein
VAPPPQKDGAGPKDKPPPPNWAKIYAELMCQAHASYFEIHNMTIPAIEAIRAELGENIAIKIGMPSLLGGVSDTPTSPPHPDKLPKLYEFINFTNSFNGI